MRDLTILIMIVSLTIGAAGALPAADCGRCGVTLPSALGPTIVSRIERIPEPDFNRAYMELMYQQNADIIGIVVLGTERACNPLLRLLSKKIIRERLDMNEDLRRWSQTYANHVLAPPKSDRYRRFLEGLAACTDDQFDCQYAAVMTGLLQQSKDAADYAMGVTWNIEIGRQARVISRTSGNEVEAIGRFASRL